MTHIYVKPKEFFFNLPVYYVNPHTTVQYIHLYSDEN